MKVLPLVFLLWSVPALAAEYGSHVVPSAARPALGASFADPVFGSTLVRRTDPSLAGSGTLGFVHEYSRFPVVNASNQLIVLQVLGGPGAGTWEIRDLATHARKYVLSPQGDPEFSWHRTDSNRLFYRSGNEVRVFHTDTGQSEVLMKFNQFSALGANEEGRPSDDWHYYAGVGDGKTVVVADLQAKTIVAQMPVSGALDWVSMSPSGNYVVAMTDDQDTYIYTRALTGKRKLLSNHAHADFAIDAQGQEVLVYEATENDQVSELGCPNPPNGSPFASARLSDGQKKILLGECNKADWSPVVTGAPIGWWFTSHFSGIASRAKPGWVLVSTYTDPTAPQNPFTREVFWLALDGSGQVRRVAQHHSDQTTLPDGSKDYWAEPHATSSWDGSLIVFGSVWGQPGSPNVYTVGTSSPTPPPPPPPSSRLMRCSGTLSCGSPQSCTGTLSCVPQ